jgi:DMSO/TMAO reductase YedYZ molybdopterin-dependent catalytic subunit
MTGPSRRFFGRARAPRDPRLPPGQHDIGSDFPVLTAEVTPEIEPTTWTFTIDGLVQSPRTWTWDELHALPESVFEGDIHCVTTWSKLGTNFSGVSLDPLLAQAAPLPVAAYAVATSTTGYTTNLPLEYLRGGKAWLAWSHEGHPLQPHGP